MKEFYDFIVIGARCAGSPAAMLLARKGYRVLLVDRATFPSDTVSTHIVHPPGMSALARWGLRERLAATGCPPIHTYAFDFGDVDVSGAPGTTESPYTYCPRRTVLDKLLIDAAAEAGAEVREGFSVDEILAENGRVVGIKGHSKGAGVVSERARVVIGADGLYSRLVEAVQPEEYNTKPKLLALYYSYWSGLPMNGRFETYIRPNRGMAAVPTHDDLTVVIVGWPYDEFEANKGDIEGNYLKTIGLAHDLADRVRSAKRVTPFAGAALRNFFRKPFGEGWALIGDAGYNKDPITGMGITDAFVDAERCAEALDQVFRGGRPYDDAMAEYQVVRDGHALPMYEFTCELAQLKPPSEEMQQLLPAMVGNQEAMDRFVQVNAGTISPAEFFAPESVNAIMNRSSLASL
jgi:2-polyprenyl-6-methoxyphenol hydroxylase-like FAD-dependent oxidoreductase